MPTTAIAFPDPSNPVLSLSALEQAARIREGTLSSQALVSLYLERIRTIDGRLGAMVDTCGEQALAEAARLDRLRAKGTLAGPFHGVPTAVKDLHFLRGRPLRMGSRAYRWLWSPVDDTLVRGLKRAGFVVLGKTSTSELALLPIVETDLHPPTRNAWNPERTAGGSSGGAGAAIAAGLVPVAPGSDGAGSIRIPSSLNGLVGMKPTRGLVPSDTKRVDVFGMASIGPMARTVDDAAALLDVICGREGGRGTAFRDASRVAPKPLKIGLILQPPLGETDPRIAAAVREAAASLAAAGHSVEERASVTGTLDEFLPVYQTLISRIPVLFPWMLQPVVRWFREEGRRLPKGAAARAFAELGARVVATMEGLDVLVTPTVPILPPKVGAFRHLPPRELFEAVAPLGAFTAASNLSGFPALTVPCGRVEGLPVGAQLIGRPGTEGLLFALARTLEDALPTQRGR